MGRPLTQRYYSQALNSQGGLYNGPNVLMPWAWVPGDTGGQPCWIVKQLSSTSFIMQQAYPEGGNPPLSGVCNMVNSYSEVNEPGTMHIGGFFYYGGLQTGSEGYVAIKEIFDNTCVIVDGAESTGFGVPTTGLNNGVAGWELDQSPPPDNYVWIYTSAYFWGPGS